MRRRTTVSVASAFLLTVVVIGAITYAHGGGGTGAPGAHRAPTGERFVRIRVLDTQETPGSPYAVWAAQGYDAQSILQIIRELNPGVLERYVSGPVNATMPVPVCQGCPQMDALEFLQASENQTGAIIIPRLSVNDFESGKLLTQAQELYDLPLSPPMRYLSLDNYAQWAAGKSQETIVSMFRQLYAQGWLGIGVNECGGYQPTYGYASFADACVNSTSWTPNLGLIASIKSESNIKLTLLYIDFPGQMRSFEALNGVTMATVLTSLARGQSADGYRLVYNILQNSGSAPWDSLTVQTQPGETVFSVMQTLMSEYG